MVREAHTGNEPCVTVVAFLREKWHIETNEDKPLTESEPIDVSPVEVENISRHGFWLLLDGEEYFLPFDVYPWFKDAPIGSILNVQRSYAGHLYWPDLDVDLEVEGILFPERYPLVYKTA